MRNVKTVALACLLLVALGVASAFAQSIEGLWKIIDDKTNSPTAIVMLYTNGGKLYGRMMATIDKNTGAIKDTIAVRKDKADALAGDPPFCGLDFVYELQAKGKDWKGSIIDPEDGKVYDCTIKQDGSKLIVRGSLKGTGGLLGRNQTWLSSGPADLPAGLVLPNPSGFVPVIPKKK